MKSTHSPGTRSFYSPHSKRLGRRHSAAWGLGDRDLEAPLQVHVPIWVADAVIGDGKIGGRRRTVYSTYVTMVVLEQNLNLRIEG